MAETSTDEQMHELIALLIGAEALRINGGSVRENGRPIPYSFDMDALRDGEGTTLIGKAFVRAIQRAQYEFDVLCGISDGAWAVIPTAQELAAQGTNKQWYVKGMKTAGRDGRETTSRPSRVLFLTGTCRGGESGTINALEELAGSRYVALMTILDTQEKGPEGTSRHDEVTLKTNMPVTSLITAADIYRHLKTRGDIGQQEVNRIATYLRVYGTRQAREAVGPLEQKIIGREKSIIVACNVSLQQFENVVRETADIEGIGGYKIPLSAGSEGWKCWVATAQFKVHPEHLISIL